TLRMSEYSEPRSIAYSPDGKILAMGGSHNIVSLWDMVARKELRTIKTHPNSDKWVDSLAFSLDGKILATASDYVTLWDVSSGRELATLDAHEGVVPSVAFSPDGSILASDGTTPSWASRVANSLPLLTSQSV